MAYKWKPSRACALAYKQAMDSAPTFIPVSHPIRTGDAVGWYDAASATVLSGKIESHRYTQDATCDHDRLLHRFSIRLDSGRIKVVRGKNLYPRLTKHVHVGNTF